MSYDIESSLKNYLQTTHFSLELDDSTLFGNEAILLAFVRSTMVEEMHADL